MILTICGTSSWDFSRLIAAMDGYAQETDEEVVIQSVSSKARISEARFIGFVSHDEIEDLYRRARIVVCHAGTGTLLSALRHGKLPILVPRLKEFGEHIDDHQLEFSMAVHEAYGLEVVTEIKDLRKVLMAYDKSPSSAESIPSAEKRKLIASLRDYIDLSASSIGNISPRCKVG